LPDAFAQAQEIAHLRAQLQQMHTYLTQREAAAAAAPSAASSSSAPAPRQPVSDNIKAPPMWKFAGQVGDKVDKFLRDIQTQFRMKGKPLTDEAMILNAAAYLDDAAADWWDSQDQAAIATWQQFVDALHARFRPLAPAENARVRIRYLKQRGSVAAYSALFQSLMANIKDMNPVDQILNYCEGLSSDEIRHRVTEKKPKALHEAMEAAISAEAYLQPRGRQGQGAFHPRGANSYSASTSSTSSTSAPMDLNAVVGQEPEFDEFADEEPESKASVAATLVETVMQQVKAQLAAILPPAAKSGSSANSGGGVGSQGKNRRYGGHFSAEKERLYNEGKCFRCKKAGHQSRECKADF
jgi:hypothetical protein